MELTPRGEHGRIAEHPPPSEMQMPWLLPSSTLKTVEGGVPTHASVALDRDGNIHMAYLEVLDLTSFWTPVKYMCLATSE